MQKVKFVLFNYDNFLLHVGTTSSMANEMLNQFNKDVNRSEPRTCAQLTQNIGKSLGIGGACSLLGVNPISILVGAGVAVNGIYTSLAYEGTVRVARALKPVINKHLDKQQQKQEQKKE